MVTSTVSMYFDLDLTARFRNIQVTNIKNKKTNKQILLISQLTQKKDNHQILFAPLP